MSLGNPSRPLPAGKSPDLENLKARAARVLRENGLSIVLFGCFAVFLVGQSLAGWLHYNEEAHQHGQHMVRFGAYLLTGHFWEAVFENWESEFFQMSAYVLLTAFLYQKGSAESKKLPEEGENPQDADPEHAEVRPDTPAPVRWGGWRLKLYERSLSGILTLVFLLSFIGHAIAGARETSQEQLEHGQHAVTVLQYLGSSKFWFESLQNWQSEFLAVFALVTLSIWFRDKGSPESKPVADPNAETGAA